MLPTLLLTASFTFAQGAQEPQPTSGALEVAVRLHGHRAELESRIDTLTRAVEGRSVLDQARGVLMERDGLTAEEADAHLHERARATGRRLVESAEEIIRSAGD